MQTLLETLNSYAAEYKKSGNKSIVAAMGRIVKRLESQGARVVINEKTLKYELKRR